MRRAARRQLRGKLSFTPSERKPSELTHSRVGDNKVRYRFTLTKFDDVFGKRA